MQQIIKNIGIANDFEALAITLRERTQEIGVAKFDEFFLAMAIKSATQRNRNCP